MPWDIDESNLHGAEIEKCKSKVNRDAAPFLFFQAVGMRPRQRFDERGFAVVNVAGRTDDDVLGRFHRVTRTDASGVGEGGSNVDG